MKFEPDVDVKTKSKNASKKVAFKNVSTEEDQKRGQDFKLKTTLIEKGPTPDKNFDSEDDRVSLDSYQYKTGET